MGHCTLLPPCDSHRTTLVCAAAEGGKPTTTPTATIHPRHQSTSTPERRIYPPHVVDCRGCCPPMRIADRYRRATPFHSRGGRYSGEGRLEGRGVCHSRPCERLRTWVCPPGRGTSAMPMVTGRHRR